MILIFFPDKYAEKNGVCLFSHLPLYHELTFLDVRITMGFGFGAGIGHGAGLGVADKLCVFP